MMPGQMQGMGGFNPQMLQELLRRKQMASAAPQGLPMQNPQMQMQPNPMMNQRPPMMNPQAMQQMQRPPMPQPNQLGQGGPQLQMPPRPNPMMQQGQRMGQQRPGFNPNQNSRFGR